MDHRQLGGYSDILGNMAMFTNGLIAYRFGDTPARKSAGASRMVTGALWNVPNLVLAKYGAQSVDRQMERLEGKLSAYLKQHDVPLDVATLKKADDEQRRGWFSKLEDFMYNHPTEINSACIALASAGILKSGFTRIRAGEKIAGAGNIAVSGLAIAAALSGILIPEKTPEQIAAKGQSGTVWGEIQKSPLSYANWIMLAGDLTEGVNARGEFKTAKALAKSDPFRKWGFTISALSAVTMVCYLVGDSLSGFGSKKNAGAPKDRNTAQRQLLEETARIVSAVPPEKREAILHDTAVYLSQQPELRMLDFSPEQLQQQVDAMLRGTHRLCEPDAVAIHMAAGKHTERLAHLAPKPLAVAGVEAADSWKSRVNTQVDMQAKTI